MHFSPSDGSWKAVYYITGSTVVCFVSATIWAYSVKYYKGVFFTVPKFICVCSEFNMAQCN